MLINAKKIRELLNSNDIKCSRDLYVAINKEVKKICLKTRDNTVAKQKKTAKASHVPKVDIFLNNVDHV